MPASSAALPTWFGPHRRPGLDAARPLTALKNGSQSCKDHFNHGCQCPALTVESELMPIINFPRLPGADKDR